MSLNFPKKSEIRLGKAPLDEVVCQVKFSPILRISKEAPIDFQESIRTRFPGLELGQGVLVQFPPIGATDKPIVEASPKLYRFPASDGNTGVTLATDFFALSTKKYSRWRDFIRDLDLVASSVINTYRPAFATRIGLRFINRFTRKNTGCKTVPQILDLFRDEITCLLRADAWTEPHEMLAQIVLLDNKAKLALRIGFAREQGEPFFLLDFDYYEEGQMGLGDLANRVKRYHTRIYDAFRWCLLDESLPRFEPLS